MDSPLTELGRQQAELHAKLIQQEGIRNLRVSPLGRVKETLEIIQTHCNSLAVQFDDDLVELGAGDWEGRHFEEVRENDTELWQARNSDLANFKPPNGESRTELLKRLWDLVNKIRSGVLIESPLGVVSHGAVTRIMMMALMDVPVDEDPSFSIFNNVVHKLEVDDSVQNVSHFVNAEGPYEGWFTTDE